MTREVNNRFNGKILFYLDKKQFIAIYKIYNSFSHKVERFFYSGFTSFTDPLLDWMECGSLGRRSTIRNQTDRWPRIVSCSSIGLKQS